MATCRPTRTWGQAGGSRPGGRRPVMPRTSRAAVGGPGHRAEAAVGYVRRSTDRQEQSIPDQQRAIERFCAERGLRLLRWYIDDAISGTSTEGRKGFQSLIADAQECGCDFGAI